MVRRALPVLAGLAGACLGAAALGMFMGPQNEPVERLVANLTKKTEERPKDAKAWYRLGRAHSLAFSRGLVEVPVYQPNEPVPDDGIPGGGGRHPYPGITRKLPIEDLRKHLAAGIGALRRAAMLDGDACEHWMSYAYLIEKGIDEAPSVDIVPGARLDLEIAKEQRDKLEGAIAKLKDKATHADGLKAIREAGEAGIVVAHGHREDKDEATRGAIATLLKEWWREWAIQSYARAFTCSLEKDLKVETVIGGFHSLISHEAGVSCLRLIKERGERPADKDRIASINEGIKKLETREYPMVITPIVFPLDVDRPLASLVNSEARVKFDLDGTGRGQEWAWVRRDTGVLVWDPINSGKIASGRQLFGSVSWWIFFDNGYEALDALDDNRDGELTGAELKGIAVWIDRNGNGVSDAGEVVPVEATGIRSIRARATSSEDGCAANRDGIVMSDGRVLPTYDWVTRALPRRDDDLSRFTCVHAASFEPLDPFSMPVPARVSLREGDK